MRCRAPAVIIVAVAIVASLVPPVAPAPAVIDAPDPVVYTITLDRPQTQTIDLEMRLTDVSSPTIDVFLPVWRPGRYVVLDPVGTVRDVRAFDGRDGPLAVEPLDKTSWRITTGGARDVRLRWRIYANSIADRTRHVDDTHAFLSGSSVFFYDPDRRGHPVEVRVRAPADWRIATGLAPHPERPDTVIAPNYDVLVDSPLEIGLHDRLVFDVDGVPHEIVIWPPGAAAYDADALVADFTTIVREERSIFGAVPYDRYVFLLHVGAGGGGTEHLNSTIMQTSREALEQPKRYRGFLALVAHEFFHTWNVKQLRPSGLRPYDYQRENYTRLLWVSEGTTSYYDDLVLVRTGLITTKRYLEIIGGSIAALRDRPGALVQSLEASSFDAWTKFNRASPDDVNSEVSFYSKGALVSLLLDLEVRRRTDGRASLDDVMRTLYARFPLSGPGFTPADVQATVETIAGGRFERFFADLVRGTATPDFDSALRTVGLELHFKPRPPDDDRDTDTDRDEADHAAGTPRNDEIPRKAWLGATLATRSGRTVVTSIPSNGPAYDAGLNADDEIVALDGRRLDAADLEARLRSFAPGDVVEITLFRHDVLRTVRVTLAGRPDGSWVIRRRDGATDAQRAAYASWLHQPWPDPPPDPEPDPDP
ncbi:MAG: M61 family metallopeptidase [Phycisphaerales bacterium]|nr:M61 family metallopeptidase [Phycisphaerales bacterium]